MRTWQKVDAGRCLGNKFDLLDRLVRGDGDEYRVARDQAARLLGLEIAQDLPFPASD
jgi:hypothetical protein